MRRTFVLLGISAALALGPAAQSFAEAEPPAATDVRRTDAVNAEADGGGVSEGARSGGRPSYAAPAVVALVVMAAAAACSAVRRRG